MGLIRLAKTANACGDSVGEEALCILDIILHNGSKLLGPRKTVTLSFDCFAYYRALTDSWGLVWTPTGSCELSTLYNCSCRKAVRPQTPESPGSLSPLSLL